MRQQVIAEILPLSKAGLLTSSIAVDNPDLMNVEWEINDTVVQRKVVSRGFDGSPKTVVIWCPVGVSRENYQLKTSTKTALGPLVPQRPPVIKLTMMINGAAWSASYQPNSSKKLKEGPYAITYRSFSQLVNRADKILGAHFYVTNYANGALDVAVRLSNGTLDDSFNFNGQVFFDDAYLEINGAKSPLVLTQGGHVILPMQQMHRRYASGATPIFSRAVSGCSPHKVGAYGAEMQKLPEYTADYAYGGKHGMDAIELKQFNRFKELSTCLANGTADSNVDMLSPRLGLFHPMYIGDSGAGAPGGWGIAPMSGLGQSQTNIDLLKVEHQCMMDRHSIVCFNQSGDYFDTHKFAATNNGVQPFYHNVIGGWKVDWSTGHQVLINEQLDSPPYFKADTGKAWNHGTCSYIGAKYAGGLRDYEYIDDEHYCRATKFAKGLIYLTGDELAIDDHRHMAEFLLFSWGIIPHKEMYVGQNDHSVKKQLETNRANPHHGGYLSRAFGWALHTLCDAYVLADDSWRRINKPWFDSIEELIDLSAMPSGVWQREGSTSHLAETAHAAGFPLGVDLCGGIYIGIVSGGAHGLMRGVLGASVKLASVMDRIVKSLYDTGPYKPHGQSYYVGVAPAGGAPYPIPQNFAGGLESYNGFWTLLAAYQITGKEEHFERLKTYADPAATHLERVKKLFVAANGWDDKIENAGYYIAEVQSRVR